MRYDQQVMASKVPKRSRSDGVSSPAKQRTRRCLREIPPVTKMNTSEPEPQPQPGTSAQETIEESPFFTPNPYQVLQNDREVMESAAIPREPKPPPIFVKNIKNFQMFCTQLNKICSGSYSCLNRTNDTKITPDSAEAYRKIVKYLSETNANFHTYQLRQERALRVVIRNLHSSTPTEVIKEELTTLGFNVRQVTNVLKEDREQPGLRNRIPLPLFFVDLEPSPGIEKIYDITRIYYTMVKVEKPYPKRDIVQCHNCQTYGHTKTYCHHLPRCVKCGEQHKSVECTKPIQDPAVCALCLEGHPANYKGCQIYKNLKTRHQKNRIQDEALRTRREREPSRIVNNDVSFSQLLRGKTLTDKCQALPQQQPQTQPQNPLHPNIPNHQQQIPHIPPPSNATDLTSLLASFLTDFKSLVTPLISLLTNLVSHLIPPLKNP